TRWTEESFPIVHRVADDGSPNSIEACSESDARSGCCEETLPAGYCVEGTERALASWDDAGCLDLANEVADSLTNPDLAATNDRTISPVDGLNQITFNDPDDVAGPGIIGLQIRSVDPGSFVLVDGREYVVQTSSDISFNNDIVFVTPEQLAAGDCPDNAIVFDAEMAHQLGHGFGLDHSCEDPELLFGGLCPQPLLDATMHWQSRPCSDDWVTIENDDIEGLNALYGPSARLTCSDEANPDLVVGTAPLAVNCVASIDDARELEQVTWQWGDGTTSEGSIATHVYEEAGNYTLSAVVDGRRDTCDPATWTTTTERVGYVRVCSEPVPDFTFVQLDDQRYQFLNESDVSVFGCISAIQLDVFVGDGPDGGQLGEPITDWEPEIRFPGRGTYHVVLSLGGIGGSAGASATIEVGERGGCSTGGPMSGGWALIVVAGGMACRRRRVGSATYGE
ncbi:MAG: PKD domain-containing protein, partial [Myxococcota bacterium]